MHRVTIAADNVRQRTMLPLKIEYVEATEMSHNRWLRRQAVQLAAQLPDGRDDALAILRYASELVTDFLEADPQAPGLRLVERLPQLPCQLNGNASPIAEPDPVQGLGRASRNRNATSLESFRAVVDTPEAGRGYAQVAGECGLGLVAQEPLDRP
jgi:hypothetical protein